MIVDHLASRIVFHGIIFAVLQIRMDAETKEAAENLYRKLGTSFAEAVRIFAVQSINEQGFPFVPKDYRTVRKSSRGILAGYASEELRQNEKNAYMEAMVAKHE